MDNSQVVNQVVSRQATVGDIINDHIHGLGGYEIAEKYNLDPKKVQDIIFAADESGKLMPAGQPAPIDKVTDTPVIAPAVEPLQEGENPEPVAEPVAEPAEEPAPEEPQMMTTENSV